MPRYRICIYFLFFFILKNSCFSQVSINIFEKEIEGKPDKEKISLLIKLCDNCRLSGFYEKALGYGERALMISGKEQMEVREADSYSCIALCYGCLNQNEKALHNFLTSYMLYEKKANYVGMANTAHNISDLYRRMRNYDQALFYIHKALEIRKAHVNAGAEALTYIGEGALYYDMDQLDKALGCFRKGLLYYNSKHDQFNSAAMENNIGSVYNDQKRYADAIENYKIALQLYSELNDSLDMSMCMANIGNVYNESGKMKEGIDYIMRGLAIAERKKDNTIIPPSYVFMIEGWQKLGDYKKAFEYQSKLMNLKDTLYDLQTSQNMAEMQTRFDTEKKEKENQILKQQNDLQNLSINRQRIINYSVSGGLLLMFLLAFYIYRNYRQKQKANEQLEIKQIEIVSKNKDLEVANSIIHEKNKDITDSIRYAKRLQSAILKPEEEIAEHFRDAFIYFRPKDIVSGDFYWFDRFGDLSLVAAADCTGHGVPGAFMSIIGCNLLSQSVNEYAITQPAAILNSVNKGLSKVLQQKTDKASVTDGMDIALCVFDNKKMIIEYAGAYNPLWIVREGKLMEFKADKFPVGAFIGDKIKQFTNHVIPVLKGDMVYVFSDGYADQFGGQGGKKFKYKQLQELLINNYSRSSSEQKEILSSSFNEWIGPLEQVDDVLVIGIRI